MDELVKTLRYYIMRDLIFLLGGGSVLVSFLYAFDVSWTNTEHVAVYLLAAGISYVIGYALQDVCGLLPILPTNAPRNLNCYLQWFYKLYVGEEWQDIPPETNFEQAEEGLKDKRQIAWLERITSLRQICTTFAPCWTFSSTILLVKYWLICGQDSNVIAAIALVGFCIVVVLGHLAWLKSAQEAQYLRRHPPTRVHLETDC
jgi:hypothetical protein